MSLVDEREAPWRSSDKQLHGMSRPGLPVAAEAFIVVAYLLGPQSHKWGSALKLASPPTNEPS